MLRITIPGMEFFDEQKSEFIVTKPYNLQLEHSLVSLSKWESKWRKPFISDTPHSVEETLDYIRCMTITQNVPEDIYKYLPDSSIKEVQEYIDLPMTATTITRLPDKGTKKKEVVTAEIIYFAMFSFGIPIECQKWHLNRLMTLIEVFNIKNAPKEKMSKRDIMQRNKVLNQSRRNKMNTRG